MLITLFRVTGILLGLVIAALCYLLSHNLHVIGSPYLPPTSTLPLLHRFLLRHPPAHHQQSPLHPVLRATDGITTHLRV